MKRTAFDISFEFDSKPFTGWIQPSEKLTEEGTPASFHVVLNGTSFGYLSFRDCKWIVNQERPAGLVKLIGKQIEKYYQI